ncbi:MAG: SdpI family protein [Clostridia bacterium]|nr:SdpI family protein [Clostridia bacterium]
MKNKKNFTILGIGVINLIASFFAVSKLSTMLPLNIFADNVVDKMCSKNMLLLIPVVVLLLCAVQVLYRLKTMDKTVTTGKRIEDALFTFITGILLLVNWTLIYIGSEYTATNLVSKEFPILYFITAIIGVLMVVNYSAYPINKFGSVIGLRTKETLEDENVWRLANRFNAFTGFVSALIVIGLSVYFALVGFNWVYLTLGIIFCGTLMFYAPKLYAQMVASKKENIIIE